MKGYDEMFQWIRRIHTTDMGESKFLNKNSTQLPTYADITLTILSSHNNKTKLVRYIDAVPTSLGDINFESTASGNEFITFATSFRFNYFELV